MKNLQPPIGSGRFRLLFKLVVIMKLSMLFIVLGLLQARADGRAQGSVTLSAQQTDISKVLTRIERKGEFRFLYNYDLPSLRTKVSVNWQNLDIRAALSSLFDHTDLTYKLLNNNL